MPGGGFGNNAFAAGVANMSNMVGRFSLNPALGGAA